MIKMNFLDDYYYLEQPFCCRVAILRPAYIGDNQNFEHLF